MFTGIITHIGSIKNIDQKNEQLYFEITTELANQIKIGDSVAVDGVCLTAVEVGDISFTVQAMPETLSLTNLKTKAIGSKMNLELPLRLNQGLDGHIVLGHVDGLGKVLRSERQPDQNWVIEIEPPESLMKYIVYKGSICINGVSLTISKDKTNSFEVSLIDYTLQNTNLCDIKIADLVNLEIDIMARYIEKLNLTSK
jgi:riboflavin synthase